MSEELCGPYRRYHDASNDGNDSDVAQAGVRLAHVVRQLGGGPPATIHRADFLPQPEDFLEGSARYSGTFHESMRPLDFRVCQMFNGCSYHGRGAVLPSLALRRGNREGVHWGRKR